MKKRWIILLIIAELMMLLIFAVRLHRFVPAPVEISFTEWTSRDAVYDQAFFADEETLGGKAHVFLQSPELPISHGAYRLHVDYWTDGAGQQFCISSAYRQNRFLRGGDFYLSRFTSSTDYRFELSEDDSVTFSVEYSGQGTMQISDVRLYTDDAPEKRAFAYVFLLFLLVDFGLLFRKRLPIERRSTVLALAGIAVLATVPYFMQDIIEGDDLVFHLMRIDAIASELDRGVFPVRMSRAWLGGYGYPASVMYGDLLLYFPAVLRLIGFNLADSYKLYVLFINLLTALSSWYCFWRIFRKNREALLLTLLYMTASYRLITIYARSAVGEYSAALFLPLVALGIWRLYTDEGEETTAPDDRPQDTRNRLRLPDSFIHMGVYGEGILCLGIGMAGIIATHVLTTEMTILILILLAVLLIRRTIRRRTILGILSAVLVCALGSMFFWVPFLDYYLRFPMAAMRQDIQLSLRGQQYFGAFVGELFAFFLSPSAKRYPPRSAGPILLGFLAAAVFICLLKWKKVSGRVRFLCGFSLLLLVLSTNLFPWDALVGRTRFGIYLAQAQFPYRYLGPACLVLTLLAGVVLEELPEDIGAIGMKKNGLFFILVIISFLNTGAITGKLYEVLTVRAYADSPEIEDEVSILNGEYLPESAHTEELSSVYRAEGVEGFSILSRNTLERRVHVDSTTRDGAWIDFPVFAYPHICVVDENGDHYPVSVGEENGMLRVILPEGFSGDLTAVFEEPWLWRAAEILSFLAICCAVGMSYLLCRRRCDG